MYQGSVPFSQVLNFMHDRFFADALTGIKATIVFDLFLVINNSFVWLLRNQHIVKALEIPIPAYVHYKTKVCFIVLVFRLKFPEAHWQMQTKNAILWYILRLF